MKPHALSMVMLIMVAGCAPSTSTAQTRAETPTIQASPTETFTPTVAPTPTFPPTPTPAILPLPSSKSLYSPEADAFIPPGAVTRLGIGTITTSSLSPDGTLLAVGGSTGVQMFDAATFDRLWAVSTPIPVYQLTWSPSGRWLGVSLMQLGGMTLDAHTGKQQIVMSGFFAPSGESNEIKVAVSPNDRLVASSGCVGLDEQRDDDYCDTAGIRVWDAKTGALADQFTTASYYPPDGQLTWSPDSKALFAGASSGYVLWDVKNHKQMPLPAGVEEREVMQFDPTWSRYAYATAGGVEISEWPSGKHILEVPANLTGPLDTFQMVLGWSPDGTKLALFPGTGGPPRSFVYDLRTGELVRFDGAFFFDDFYAWAADGEQLATRTLSENQLLLWDGQSRDAPQPISMPFTYAEPRAFVGHDIVLVDSKSSSVVTYDPISQKVTHRITGTLPVFDLAWSPDNAELGTELWTSANNVTQATVWDVASDHAIRTCTAQDGFQWANNPLYIDEFSYRTTLASGTHPSWDAGTCHVRPGANFAGNSSISPDGRWSAQANGTLIRILSTNGKGEEQRWHRKEWVDWMAWSGDSSRLISQGRQQSGTEIGIWDVTRHQTVFERHFDVLTIVLASCCSPDGSQMVMLSVDIIPLYFQTYSRAQMTAVDIHSGTTIFTRNVLGETPDTSGAFIVWSPNGRVIAKVQKGDAGAGDGASYSSAGTIGARIDLYDATTGALLKTLRGHTNQIYDAAWSPDGTMLATGSTDGTVILWDTSDWVSTP